MKKNFKKRLNEYLSSECDDYDLSYELEWNEDIAAYEAEITRLSNSVIVNFKFMHGDLMIELTEDNYVRTREFDQTIKYFWMLICPKLF